MRSEKEMMDLIVGTAKADERIRGVYMNGSRTNPNAPHDVFQDYDIVYVVTETASFIEDENWIDRFGKRLYMQLPERMDRMLGMESDWENCYGYLMQLADGNRIDLHLVTLSYGIKDILHDRLCIVLLDKDDALPKIGQSTDEDHWVKKPTKEEFEACCNEFWWLLNSIGKGLWRKEVTYTMDMLNAHSRPELIKMLSWYVGGHRDYTVSVGKSGKYLSRYLTEEQMKRLLLTYPGGELRFMWQAVFAMCDLFDETARKTAELLGFFYNEKEAYYSRLFLDCTYELPSDADKVYMVRRMKPSDVETIAEIWRKANIDAHDFIPSGYWEENYGEVKKQLAEAEIYVYEDDRGIHGFVGLDRGYIQGIFVRKEERHRGVGNALLSVCKSKNFRLQLHVYCKNNAAVEFYMKEGFIISKRQEEEATGQEEYEMIWKK